MLEGEREDTASVYWDLKEGGVIVKVDENDDVIEQDEENNIVAYIELDVTLFNLSPSDGTRGKIRREGCICEVDSGVVDRHCVLQLLGEDSVYSVEIMPSIVQPKKDYSIWIEMPYIDGEAGLYNFSPGFNRWVRLDAVRDSTFLRAETKNTGSFSILLVADTIPPCVRVLVDKDITIYDPFPVFNAIARDGNGVDVMERGIEVILDGEEMDKADYSFPLDPQCVEEVPIVIRPDSLSEGKHILVVSAWDVNGNVGGDSLPFGKATHLKLEKWGVYPNPASRQTKFWFKFSKVPEGVRVEIYTTGGRSIEKLSCIPLTEEVILPWDLRDRSCKMVANGAYFFKVTASSGGETVKFIEKMAVMR